MEVLYGFGAGNPTKFRKISPGLYITDEVEVSVADILNAPLPTIPFEPIVHMHWLAVEGVQPKIPENDVADSSSSVVDNPLPTVTMNAPDPSSSGVERKPLVKHVLTDEMQLYFDKVTDAIKSDEYARQHAAYASLTKDPGLHQLLPYFSKFIYDQVKHSQRDLTLLTAILRMARCLLSNSSLRIELYVSACLGSVDMVDLSFCFGGSYESLQLRVSKTYHEAFLDPTRPFTSQYGAIVGTDNHGHWI
ncbi:hypothetical protein DYB28_015149, partial [Aphanomyces astaci]